MRRAAEPAVKPRKSRKRKQVPALGAAAAPASLCGFELSAKLDAALAGMNTIATTVTTLSAMSSALVKPSDMTQGQAGAVHSLYEQMDAAMHALARERLRMVSLIKVANAVSSDPEHCTVSEHVLGVSELFVHIVSYLDKPTLAVLSQTSSSMCTAVRNRVHTLYIGSYAKMFIKVPGPNHKPVMRMNTGPGLFHKNFVPAEQTFAIYQNVDRIVLGGAYLASDFSLKCAAQLLCRQQFCVRERKPTLSLNTKNTATIDRFLLHMSLCKVPLNMFAEIEMDLVYERELEELPVMFYRNYASYTEPLLVRLVSTERTDNINRHVGKYLVQQGRNFPCNAHYNLTVAVTVPLPGKGVWEELKLTYITTRSDLLAIADVTNEPFESYGFTFTGRADGYSGGWQGGDE